MSTSRKVIGNVKIIPQPVKIMEGKGELQLTEDFFIQVPTDAKKIGEYLQTLLKPAFNLDLQVSALEEKEEGSHKITLQIDRDLNIDKEGYFLSISEEKVEILGKEDVGLYHGVQTFRQILPYNLINFEMSENSKIFLPHLRIEDYPRFNWRGFMLDEGRHFQGKEIVKTMLEIMALLKLNIFHWHLTDDQGWRIQSKQYPKLIEIGSKRKGTQVGGFISKKIEETPHEGHYKQEDIKEIISYASDRFIEIIPEIEMPGHCMAALAAYPELSCTGGPFEIPNTFGIKKDVFCVGKEKVFQFLENVLQEVMEIFPSNIIHIGGDEVPKDRWKNCLDCQRRIQEENLKNVEELQPYFTNRIAQFLSSKEHATMGWNQILKEGLQKDVIIQYWMGRNKKIINALRQGRNMVFSKFGHVYLDYKYEFTPLRKSYRYEPIPKNLEEEYHENVLGIEAPLWTEWVPNRKRLYWQAFPRLVAVAETGWSLKRNKNYKSFKDRLKVFNKKLQLLGAGHAKMEEIDPPAYKTLFGIFTIFTQPRGEI